MNDVKYDENLLKMLFEGVTPALGCTEPVAVGLASSRAFEEVEGEVKNIKIRVSPNIFKNGMGVGIPGTSDIGLRFAAALGTTCGKSKLGLEVFKGVNKDSVDKAHKILHRNSVDINLEDREGKFFIETIVETDKGLARCIIRNTHANIVLVEKNSKVCFEKKVEADSRDSSDYLRKIKIVDIIEFVETVDFPEIEFLLEGIDVNFHIAKVGLKEKFGVGLGAALNLLMSEGQIKKDIINEARILTSAACDARMSGANIPVMSSAGSGNQGLTAIIPPAIMCQYSKCGREKTARTLAFSHLMTAYIKSFTGNLSPVCSCALAAGIGASASIVWMLGGSEEKIGIAVKNMVGTLAGLVCDGAKGGCAFKLSTASSEAILQAKLAMNGVSIGGNDGILNPETEKTIRNLGRFCNEGMQNADNEIISIMLGN